MRTLIAYPDSETPEQGLEREQAWSVAPDKVTGREAMFSRLAEPYDAIAVHSGIGYDAYPWDWMPALRRLQPQARIMVALDETVSDSFMMEAICRLADALSFAVLPAGIEGRSRIEAFVSFLQGEAVRESYRQEPGAVNGAVVTVWGAASKDGATTVALNTALALASRGGIRVGLIDANLRNPEVKARLNVNDPGMASFVIRSKLQTQRLRPEELVGACIRYRQRLPLYILPGSPRRDTAQDVTPEMMTHLIAAARQAFDVTFIDVNSYPDNAATICAVREADHRWLVTQNRYASYRTSWGEWYACFWSYCGLAPKDVSLIVNRSYDGDRPERIADYLGMRLAAAVPNVLGGLGLASADEGVPLYDRPGAEPFTASIDGLAAQLDGQDEAMSAGAAPVTAVRPKISWLHRFAAKFG